MFTALKIVRQLKKKEEIKFIELQHILPDNFQKVEPV